MLSSTLIHTGLYTDKAYNAVKAFVDNYSWAGELGTCDIDMSKDVWSCIEWLYSRGFVERHSTNEVVIDRFFNWTDNEWRSAIEMSGMSFEKILAQLGRCIYDYLKTLFSKNLKSHMDDKIKLIGFRSPNIGRKWNEDKPKKYMVKVKDLMFVADLFLKKDVIGIYGKKYASTFIGEQLDPIAYETVKTANEELDALDAESEKTIESIKDEYKKAVQALRQEIEREFQIRTASIDVKYKTMLDAAKTKFAKKKNDLKSLISNARSGKSMLV